MRYLHYLWFCCFQSWHDDPIRQSNIGGREGEREREREREKERERGGRERERESSLIEDYVVV
jgi:hypothetical protein